MHMGYFAASNVHQRMQERLQGTKPKFLNLDEIPPMIGLAVGKKAIAYWPEAGVTHGEDVMKAFFGDDLGFSSKLGPISPFPSALKCIVSNMNDVVCWNHLRLGEEAKAP